MQKVEQHLGLEPTCSSNDETGSRVVGSWGCRDKKMWRLGKTGTWIVVELRVRCGESIGTNVLNVCTPFLDYEEQAGLQASYSSGRKIGMPAL
jgi:hypothetical protein